MNKQTRPFCMPIKSPSGETVGLVSTAGVELWDKRLKRWDVYTLDTLVKIHTQVVSMAEVVEQKKEMA